MEEREGGEREREIRGERERQRERERERERERINTMNLNITDKGNMNYQDYINLSALTDLADKHGNEVR